MSTETTFGKRIGEDHYEVRCTAFETIVSKRGFNRRTVRTRHYYYINGTRTLRTVFLARKNGALLTDTERVERDAKDARAEALLQEYLAS